MSQVIHGWLASIRRNAIAWLALAVALAGTSAYAADKLVVTGKNVKNGSLTGKDLKANSLTGKQVKESRLGAVPSADRAGHADTADSADQAGTALTAVDSQRVGGIELRAIDAEVPLDQPPQTVLDLGGLQLRATCTVATGITLKARTTRDNSLLHVGAIEADNSTNETEDSDFDTGEEPAIHSPGSEGTATVTYRRPADPGRKVVSATVAFEDAAASCQVYGHALAGP